MLIAYWIVAGLLAIAYVFAGGTKLVRSKEKLEAQGMKWVSGAHPALIKLVGLLELLGAVGLIVPPLVGIAVATTVFAAVGLVLVQAVAIGVHMTMRDVRGLPVNIALLALALAAAWLAASVFVVG